MEGVVGGGEGVEAGGDAGERVPAGDRGSLILPNPYSHAVQHRAALKGILHPEPGQALSVLAGQKSRTARRQPYAQQVTVGEKRADGAGRVGGAMTRRSVLALLVLALPGAPAHALSAGRALLGTHVRSQRRIAPVLRPSSHLNAMTYVIGWPGEPGEAGCPHAYERVANHRGGQGAAPFATKVEYLLPPDPRTPGR